MSKTQITQKKVQFSISCKCGSKIMNDEMMKKADKFYCPKCNIEIISINN
jgi:predicted SprT family Zn-dependent metalloprotease